MHLVAWCVFWTAGKAELVKIAALGYRLYVWDPRLCLGPTGPLSNYALVFWNKVRDRQCGLLYSSGPAQMDVLYQHCGHLQFCSLFWDWPRPHSLVHRGRALQPGAPACCHRRCWFLKLVGQLFSRNVLPVCWGKIRQCCPTTFIFSPWL